MPVLVETIKAQEARRLALVGRREALTAPPIVLDDDLRAKLTTAVEEWREVLGRQVVQPVR